MHKAGRHDVSGSLFWLFRTQRLSPAIQGSIGNDVLECGRAGCGEIRSDTDHWELASGMRLHPACAGAQNGCRSRTSCSGPNHGASVSIIHPKILFSRCRSSPPRTPPTFRQQRRGAAAATQSDTNSDCLPGTSRRLHRLLRSSSTRRRLSVRGWHSS